MSVCPNKSSQEWKDLERVIGPDKAQLAYNLNKDEIPTVSEALTLLKTMQTIESDERLSSASDEFKLKRAIDQSNMLDIAKKKLKNVKQIETIEGLLRMNREYIEFLNQNIANAKKGIAATPTLSVTKFIGSSTFVGDPTEYERFKYFGTFMHDVLEKAQIKAIQEEAKRVPQEGNTTPINISKILTREYFQEVYDEYTAKYPFDIVNLTVDAMYEQAVEIANVVTFGNGTDIVILPEITVTGTSKTGAKILGRLDLVVIGADGKINILDFKTKKVEGLVNPNAAGQQEADPHGAIQYMASRTYRVQNGEGVGEAFSTVLDRTTFDTWLMQLDIYEAMLRQSKFEVGSKKVISLMYQTDKDTQDFKASFVYTFNDQQYYQILSNLNINKKNTIYQDAESIKNVTVPLINAVKTEVPVEGDTITADTVFKKKAEESFEFMPDDPEMLAFVASIKNITESQLTEAYAKRNQLRSRKDAKRNHELEAVLSQKIQSLKNFQGVIQKYESKGDLSSIMHASNFFGVVDQITEEIEKYSVESKEVIEKFRANKKVTNRELETLTAAYSQSEGVSEIMTAMRDMLNKVEDREDIPENSQVKKDLGEIEGKIQRIRTQFREVTLDMIVKDFIMAPGETVFSEVNAQLEDIYSIELLEKRRQLEVERAGLGKESVFRKVKGSLISLMDSGFKAKMKEEMSATGRISMVKAERLENDIRRLELLEQGYKFDESSLQSYVTGITNPNSVIYMGSQDVHRPDNMLKGWHFDKIIAAASNSDLGISTFATTLKNWEAQARENAMNDLDLVKFANLLDDLLKSGYSLEQLNDAFSEWKTVDFYNHADKEMSSKRILSTVTVYSESFVRTYDQYNIKMRLFNAEVKAAKTEYLDNYNTPEKDSLERAYLDKIAERDSHNTEYIDWLVKYTNTPYVDAFYNLQKELPADIRDKIQKIHMEQEALMYTFAKGEESLLDDSDFERLQELDIELKKLREDAKTRDPKYAEYIDKLDELYEYDTNDEHYRIQEKKAKIRYSDDPIRLQQWYDTNWLIRPNQAWYDELSSLYDQRAEIFSSDPEVMALINEKSSILRPYRINGKINPKYLSDSDIIKIDEIESKLEELMERLSALSKMSPLTAEQREKSKMISQKINSITTLSINPNYTKEFDDNYNSLKSAYDEMNIAQDKYERAKASGDKAKLTQAEDDLNFTTNHFFTLETEFAIWYNKKHLNVYKEGDLINGKDIRNMKIPKKFNYEKLPNPAVKDIYMEGVPNPKYYKVKRLRLGNWTLDGKKLTNAEIEDLQADVTQMDQLEQDGRLDKQPGAYNPNYIKSAEGIPLPKEVMLDANGRYVIDPNAVETGNVNGKYMALYNDPTLKEFYHAGVDLFFNLQKETEGRVTSTTIPGFASSMVENIARDGVGGAIKKQLSIFKDKHINGIIDAESEQDTVGNEWGDLKSGIRMRFSGQLGENIQSEDAIGAILKWSTEAHFNIAMQEVAPKSEAYIEFMKMQRSQIENMIKSGQNIMTNDQGDKISMDARYKEINTVIDLLEYEHAKYVKGQYDTTSNRAVKKVLNALFSYTAFIRIGFDVANQVKNYTAGNVQAWIAAGGHESNKYSRRDWLWGKGRVYGHNGFLHSYMKDWGRITDLSHDTMLYRFFNPLQKDFMKYYTDVAAGRKRNLSETLMSGTELGFIGQDKGDTEIGVTVMFAVMNHYKFDVTDGIDPTTGQPKVKLDDAGNPVKVAVHEAYYINGDGQFVIRPDVNFTKQDEARIRNIIYSEIRRAQGNYAKSDQTYLEQSAGGKALVFFRKFLVPGMLNRFGHTRANWEGSEVAMGYWRAVGTAWRLFGPMATMKEMLVGSKTLKKLGTTGLDTYIVRDAQGKEVGRKDVGDTLIKRVHQARQDAIMMTILSTLSLLALSFVRGKDDDDEELSMLEGNAIRIIWGTSMEATSMFPIGSGSTEYVKNFTTSVPLVRELTAVLKTGNHAYSLIGSYLMNGGEEPDPDYDSAFYQRMWKDAFYSRESGPYEKGDARLKKDFADLTGIKNFRDFFDPSARIDILKRNQ